MQIKPCGHRVLVKQASVTEEDKVFARANKAGILIAGSELDRNQAGLDKGTVIQIGPTAFKDFGGEAWCAVGDKVAFAKYAGKAIKDEDTDTVYIVLNDEDIVAVLEK